MVRTESIQMEKHPLYADVGVSQGPRLSEINPAQSGCEVTSMDSKSNEMVQTHHIPFKNDENTSKHSGGFLSSQLGAILAAQDLKPAGE